MNMKDITNEQLAMLLDVLEPQQLQITEILQDIYYKIAHPDNKISFSQAIKDEPEVFHELQIIRDLISTVYEEQGNRILAHSTEKPLSNNFTFSPSVTALA